MAYLEEEVEVTLQTVLASLLLLLLLLFSFASALTYI